MTKTSIIEPPPRLKADARLVGDLVRRWRSNETKSASLGRLIENRNMD